MDFRGSPSLVDVQGETPFNEDGAPQTTSSLQPWLSETCSKLRPGFSQTFSGFLTKSYQSPKNQECYVTRLRTVRLKLTVAFPRNGVFHLQVPPLLEMKNRSMVEKALAVLCYFDGILISSAPRIMEVDGR